MVRILCYGHSDTSSSLVGVNNGLYSLMVEQNTVNICIDVQIILRAFLTKVEYNSGGYSLKVELLYVA